MNKTILSAFFALLICAGASHREQPIDPHDTAVLRFERNSNLN